MRHCEATPHERMMLVHPDDQLIALANQHSGYVRLQGLRDDDGAQPFGDGLGFDWRLYDAELPKKPLCGVVGPSHDCRSVACYAPPPLTVWT